MVRHFWSPVVTKAVAASVFLGALLAVPARANAQTPPPGTAGALGQGFGDKGQLVITNEALLGFDKVNHGIYTLTVKPALDYFVVPSVSAGLVASYVQRTGGSKTEGVGARVGFNLNVTENLGVWPSAGIIYEHDSAGNASFSTTWVRGFLPVLYHFVPHFFAGLAPYYNLKVAGDG